MKMLMLQGLRFEIETLFFLSKVKLLQNKYLVIFFFFVNSLINCCLIKGEICCNGCVLASWEWMPLFLEQHADH